MRRIWGRFCLHMTQANKILVVDDEVSLVQLCQIILEDSGYRVRGAVTGSEALHLIEEEMPDLVLLDVMMPGMDGMEVCQQIRAQYTDTRPFVLMYTADDRERTRQNCLEAGANDLITKDVPVHELASTIDRFMTGYC
ncbi:MAG: response regulator [Chloroflexi bacterium]|nr:response regulator [Chloroflexota bacterium]